jgi:low affinity Fe/Cu permease
MVRRLFRATSVAESQVMAGAGGRLTRLGEPSGTTGRFARSEKMSIDRAFAAFANRTARIAGSPWAFGACLAVVLAWAIAGPAFRFSATWQLVINTGTTIVTFLMVFLIQNTQNRDGAAIQAKLDELILTSKAENEFIGIEKLTDRELTELRDRCRQQAERQARLDAKLKAETTARAARRKTGGRTQGRKAA